MLGWLSGRQYKPLDNENQDWTAVLKSIPCFAQKKTKTNKNKQTSKQTRRIKTSFEVRFLRNILVCCNLVTVSQEVTCQYQHI